jgi:lysyl-tRNA synthetase class II
MKLVLLSALLAAVSLAAPAFAANDGEPPNDYPTSARADYVLGCMAANHQTRQALDNCSCSIDVIASILPYDRYVEAETVLSVRQGVGAQARAFNATKAYDDVIADLRRAQAEAEISCFH